MPEGTRERAMVIGWAHPEDVGQDEYFSLVSQSMGERDREKDGQSSSGCKAVIRDKLKGTWFVGKSMQVTLFAVNVFFWWWHMGYETTGRDGQREGERTYDGRSKAADFGRQSLAMRGDTTGEGTSCWRSA